MMIFDRFPDRKSAEAFGRAVRAKFVRGFTVHDSQEDSNRVDPFPYRLTAPIVLIERVWDEEAGYIDEEAIEAMVSRFSGEYAGT